MGQYFVRMGVGGGELGWMGQYFGWMGAGGGELGWVHCLIMPITIALSAPGRMTRIS